MAYNYSSKISYIYRPLNRCPRRLRVLQLSSSEALLDLVGVGPSRQSIFQRDAQSFLGLSTRTANRIEKYGIPLENSHPQFSTSTIDCPRKSRRQSHLSSTQAIPAQAWTPQATWSPEEMLLWEMPPQIIKYCLHSLYHMPTKAWQSYGAAMSQQAVSASCCR
jgi:hypothetical protein